MEHDSVPTLTTEIKHKTRKTYKKDFITPKLVAALDRCQLTIRDSMFILEATLEALGHTSEDFSISKSTIQRIRSTRRKDRAEAIKRNFQDKVPDVVTIHWDGKLFPALDSRKSKEERLPIVISYGSQEQLLAVPRLESSTGREQAQAVWNAIADWNLEDKVQILCCATTASNTGRVNGACTLIEQRLNREVIIFACRHHIYELVLKAVFEIKVTQVTTSPDIPLFKKLQDNWKHINTKKVQLYRDKLSTYIADSEIEDLLAFYKAKLTDETLRKDYRELVELSIIFLGGDAENKLKIRPPGAMHQARWIARALYSLKITLFSAQLNIESQNIFDFVSVKSKFLFDRLNIDASFLKQCPTLWSNDVSFQEARKQVSTLRVVNDTAERAVKLMKDFHGLITVEEDQKRYLLRCVQEHRKVYPDCKKKILKRKFE